MNVHMNLFCKINDGKMNSCARSSRTTKIDFIQDNNRKITNYKFSILIDDSDESRNVRQDDTCIYIQPKRYTDNDVVGDFNKKFKDYGNSLFVDTLNERVIPILDFFDKIFAANKQLPSKDI